MQSTLQLRCARCGGALAAEPGELRCGDCGQLYDEPLPGIPDLRLSYPDPQLSRDDDERIAAELANRSPEHDLCGLLDLHWRLVGKQPELAARFTAQELAAASKAGEIVDAIDAAGGAPTTAQTRALEVGCGTAALGAALAARGASVVATDLSRRWPSSPRSGSPSGNRQRTSSSSPAQPKRCRSRTRASSSSQQAT